MNSVHLSGADELDKVLAMLPVEIARKELDKALLAGARVVAREMKLRAPVDDDQEVNAPHPPGTGKRSIRARIARPSEYGAIARLVGHNRFSAAAIAGVGSKGWYLRFIEWGFFLVRADKRIRFVGPRPFLRPAWDATKHIALDTVGKTLARGVEAAATRLTGRYRTSGFSKRGRTFIG